MLKKLIKNTAILAILVAGISLLVPFVEAYTDPLLGNVIGDNLPKPSGANGEEMLNWLIHANFLFYVKWLFVSISIGYLTFYGFMYITSSGKEENITEQHDNLIWALLGFAVVGISSLAIDIFAPIKGTYTEISSTGAIITKTVKESEIINTGLFSEAVMNVIVFLEYMLGAIAILYMVLGAIRFIMAGGDESVIDNEKKNFTWGFFGLIIVMIADVFIKVIYNQNTKEFAGEAGTDQAINEFFGVVNFVLAIMAVIGVLTLVIAGVYFVTAIGDEESTTKAKGIIKSTIAGFIIITLAYAVVYTFIGN